jgi:hypothetical protein
LEKFAANRKKRRFPAENEIFRAAGQPRNDDHLPREKRKPAPKRSNSPSKGRKRRPALTCVVPAKGRGETGGLQSRS